MGNLGSNAKTFIPGDCRGLTPRTSVISRFRCFLVILAGYCLVHSLRAQQPTEPTAPSPINGETYYLVDQISGLQADLNSGSAAAGADLVQNTRSFANLTQRWAFTLAPSGNWKISNISSGLCMDTQQASTPFSTVQQPCAISQPTQEWIFTYVTNGYYTVQNAATGLLLDIAGSSTTVGADLVQTASSSSPTQSQLWLFRPVFIRGVDNALLAKQEADRLISSPLTSFFNDAGQVRDDLLILKNHGVNMIRLRPTPLVVPGTSTPLYSTYTLGSSTSIPATCTGNGCSAETDAADIAIAQRAKNLGMSVELTLLYDGASSTAAPAAWNGYTTSQVSAAISTYVKAQIEEYRAAGVMPDIVSIGNEVNTGFLGTGVAGSASGSPSGAYNSTAFTNFATYQIAGMQAVMAAASDTTLGPAVPAPLTCIHTTPAWLINSFYPEATQAGIPYDMVCESYYPIYHGPLTAAQAAQPTTSAGCTSPTSVEPEQTNLANGITAVNKPILLIEIGEHYETGFDTTDCFYPNTRAGQRQFTLDIQSTMESLSSNLGAGMTWWDATGTNVPAAGEGYANYNEAGYPVDLYYWDGLTLFDDADNGSYSDVFTAPTYNTVLPALNALGGTLDPTLAYKFVNASDGRILETAAALTTSGASLDTGLNTEITSQNQEWQITSNGNGYFQIASLNPASPMNVLDTQGLTTAGSPVVQVSAAANTPSQEWDIVTAGKGYYTITNDASGLVLATAPGTSNGADTIQQQTPSSTNVDWITPAGMNQMWQIIPVHIVTQSTPTTLVFDPAPIAGINTGGNPGTVTIEIENAAGVLTGSTSPSITLTITGPGGFSQTETATSSAGLANFDLSSIVLTTVGTYSISATSSGLTSASASLTVTAAPVTGTTTVLTAPAASVVGLNLTLTATVTGTSGTPLPTGQVTFLDGATILGTGTLNPAGVATYTTSALAVGSYSLTASYTGDTNNGPSTSNAISVTITATPDFAVSLSPTSATIASGSSATSTISITPANGFAAATVLTCSGLPSFASCTFSPASVTPNAAAGTSTLTIATGVQTASVERRPPVGDPGLAHRLGSSGLGVLFSLLFWPIILSRKRGSHSLRIVGSLFLVALALQGFSGCGGGSSTSGNPIGPTTPSGQYTVTVTATSGTLAHTATFALTVQ
jgi:arabinogalactan endo-1,4-beta-galactosidase